MLSLGKALARVDSVTTCRLFHYNPSDGSSRQYDSLMAYMESRLYV